MEKADNFEIAFAIKQKESCFLKLKLAAILIIVLTITVIVLARKDKCEITKPQITPTKDVPRSEITASVMNNGKPTSYNSYITKISGYMQGDLMRNIKIEYSDGTTLPVFGSKEIDGNTYFEIYSPDGFTELSVYNRAAVRGLLGSYNGKKIGSVGLDDLIQLPQMIVISNGGKPIKRLKIDYGIIVNDILGDTFIG